MLIRHTVLSGAWKIHKPRVKDTKKTNSTLKSKQHICTHIMLPACYNQMESSRSFLGPRVKTGAPLWSPKPWGTGVKGEGLENTVNRQLANVGTTATFFFLFKKETSMKTSWE